MNFSHWGGSSVEGKACARKLAGTGLSTAVSFRGTAFHKNSVKLSLTLCGWQASIKCREQPVRWGEPAEGEEAGIGEVLGGLEGLSPVSGSPPCRPASLSQEPALSSCPESPWRKDASACGGGCYACPTLCHLLTDPKRETLRSLPRVTSLSWWHSVPPGEVAHCP